MAKKNPIRVLLIVIGFFLILFLGFSLFYRPLDHNDFDTVARMSERLERFPRDQKYARRAVSNSLNELNLKLSTVDSMIFGEKELTLHFFAGESDRVFNYAFSQFEVGPGSGHFFDATFILRPQDHVVAPLLFGDVIRPLAGVKGSFYMDFYSVESGVIDIDEFLGKNLHLVQEGFELMKPYQKIEDRGKYTWFLDPFKSPYRIEVNEPDEEERKSDYYQSLYRCFDLYLEAYVNALDAAPISYENREVIKSGYKEMTDLIQEHDIAIKLGRRIFPEEIFPIYFFEGFWRQE